MELRPVRTALLAGRAASRWATSTSTSNSTSTIASRPSLPVSLLHLPISRSFSSTRPALQEADAAAPLPSGGMAGYFKDRARQQSEQQQQQQQPNYQTSSPSQQQSASPAPSNSIFAAGPSPAARLPNSSKLNPWASPRPGNVQVVPHSNRSTSFVTDQILADLGLDKSVNPTAADLEKQRTGMFYEKPIDIKYRLRPVVGRTVELTTAPGMDGTVGRRLDFARGLARLDMQCKVNRVRADVNRQRFHERNGLKRKRLKSERWQRRFMDGFKATCRRVKELAKQGW